jgi:carboxylesterase type B
MHQITAYGGTKPPFQQAIMQSPAFRPSPTNDTNEATFETTLKYASLVTEQNITTVQQLRNLSQQEIYDTNYATIYLANYSDFTYGPIVDGIFSTALPGTLLIDGQFDQNLKVMTSHNADEGY